MKTGPAEGAAGPVKGAADEEPPTVLLGALKVKVPNGETLVLQTTFDTGSDTDAVSETVATRLKELGVSWGEAGGGVRMAVSSNVAIPHGQLRLMLVAEPRRGDSQAEAGEIAIPRTLDGPQKQATLSTAAMTTRAQSSAAKALLESTDVSKTGLNQSKTPVSKSKTPVSDPKPSFDVLKRELRPRNSSKNEFQDSKTPSLGPKTRFGDLKQQFSESKHAKTKFDKSKTLVSDPKTPVSEQGDKENTSFFNG